jgi:hypothetical protein
LIFIILSFITTYPFTRLLFLTAVTSTSNMVKYLTRFTDEIFSFLISAIFIVNACTDMPSIFGTTTGRDLLVPLFDIPVWIQLLCFIPAIMASILLFFDQNITVRLVNNPKWKMSKGRRVNNIIDGMHGDMLVVSVLVAIQSLLGLPWLIASTVHSVAHVQALAMYDRNGNVVSLIEQRLTGIVIHMLMACCVLFASPRRLLSQLSLPVFTGLFLYLGITSLPGNEMWERLIGTLKDNCFIKNC